MKKAIKKGLVLVDGEVGETGQWIKGGEAIVYQMPVKPNLQKVPALTLKVHFEDDQLAIVEKPAGLLTSGNKWMTLANALPYNLQVSKAIDALAQPQPAHRLDYPTSGLLLIGKTATSLAKLNHLFEKRAIQKTYHAVVVGELPQAGVIKEPIKGKPAVTHFQRLRRLVSKRFAYLSLVALSPETGRRHQLRMHLSGLGCPILGDREYGQEGLILKGKGLYLHASQLVFDHPFDRSSMVVKSELPKKYRALFPELEEK